MRLANPLLLGSIVFASLVGTARSQDIINDIFRERRDEQRLFRDERRLQQDLNNGNLFGALNDINNIQRDQNRVQRDQQQIQYDIYGRPTYVQPGQTYVQQPAQTYYQQPAQTYYQQPAQNYVQQPAQTAAANTLTPHPSYPGYYYYPSNPAQLYYYPGQQPQQPAATQPAATQPAAPPVATQPAQTAAVMPRNPTPAVQTTKVSISNPASTGVAIRFTIDDAECSLDPGYTQKFDVTSASIIAFDRGGDFGEARYTIPAPSYEFRYTAQGWNLFKKEAASASPMTNTPPRNPLPNAVPTSYATPDAPR